MSSQKETTEKKTFPIIMSVREISEEYNLSPYTVRRFIAAGLPILRSGKKIFVNRFEFENYIRGGKNNG